MSSPLLLWTPPRFVLPEYVLDFGSIIPGKVLSHTVNVTNTGSVPVSFHANCKNLIGTGMQYVIILWRFQFFICVPLLSCDSSLQHKYAQRSTVLYKVPGSSFKCNIYDSGIDLLF